MGRLDLKSAIALQNDPTVQALQRERLTPEVLELVEAHKLVLAARIAPTAWTVVHDVQDGWRLTHKLERSTVIWSIALEDDGRPWLHLSASKRARTPFHEEMGRIRDLFIGDRYAYAVWPPSDRYVNHHSFVLHLWAPWWPEHDAHGQRLMPLPEFSKETAVAGRSI